ncbi:hypothetical protein H6501_03410 [Candidatus Woesearchaeota archaeon]|nr:hypothetical protein [Candidatus Woesearchaeota archaeon]USN43701.1 MAG: hypothetical protein H6500_04910 [Candidatus Woesearchaeota archaeon]
MRKESIIRITFAAFGLIFLFFLLRILFVHLLSFDFFIQDSGLDPMEFFSPLLSLLSSGTLLLFFTYICFKVALHGKQSLTYFSSSAISLALLFLSFSFFLLSLQLHSHELASSVQGSIDTILVSQLDDLIKEQTQIDEGQEVLLLTGENPSKLIFSAKNLSPEQAGLLLNTFGIKLGSVENNVLLGKLLITFLYDSLSSSYPAVLESGIPLSSLKEIVESQIPEDLFSTLDASLLASVYDVNPEAHITLITYERTQTLSVKIAQLSEEDSLRIWTDLGFNPAVSYETRSLILDILLSAIHSSLGSDFEDFPLPLASVKGLIPPEYQNLGSYDLFSDNLSTRVHSLEQMRSDCNSDLFLKDDQMCEYILMSSYDVALSSLGEDGEIELPVSTKALDSISTIAKLEKKIFDSGSFWLFFLFLYIFFLLLAFLFLFLHFSVVGLHKEPLALTYELVKKNVVGSLWALVGNGLVLWLVAGGVFASLLSLALPSTVDLNTEFLGQLPLLQAVANLLFFAFLLTLLYALLSVALYFVLFFIVKKQEKLHKSYTS